MFVGLQNSVCISKFIRINSFLSTKIYVLTLKEIFCTYVKKITRLVLKKRGCPH